MQGCQRLKAVVHNQTQYTFLVDDVNYHSVSSSGGAPQGTNQSFVQILPDSVQGGPTILFVDGASADNDVVDTSVRYYATLNGKRKGPTMTLTLQKDACYSQKPVNIWNDDHCYSHGITGCTIDWTHCSRCTSNTDDICQKDFVYQSTDCSSVLPMTSSNVHSSVKVDAGLYTTGAVLDPTSGENMGANPAAKSSSYARFVCGQPSECGTTSNSHCPNSTDGNSEDSDNKEAKMEFYINPSPIEELTVTLNSFNAQTPIAKIMKDSIYNNLNAQYLGQLGSYFSYSPVVVGDKTLKFSTLCNSVNCPQPSS